MSYDLKISNGDISLKNDGTVQIVDKNSKLRQDILKILLTDIGENKFHKFYGSAAGKLEIGSILDQNFFKNNLKSSVSTAINNLIALQRNQLRYQYVSPAETIVSISSVDVYRDNADPRMWSIFVSVLTLEQEEISQTITIRI